jgi:hypothetical protein
VAFFINLTAIVAVGSYLFFSKKGANRDPFSIVVPFTAVYILNYVVRGVDLYFGRSTIFGGDMLDQLEQLQKISILALLGYLAFYIGYSFKRKNTQGTFTKWLAAAEISLGKLTFYHIVVISVSLTAIVFLLIRAQVSPWEYVIHLNYYRLDVNNDVAYLKFLINISGITGILYYAISCERGQKKSITLLAVPFLLNFLFAHRHFAVFYLFSLLTVHHYLVRKFSLRAVFSLAIVTFMLNGLYGAYRDFVYVYPDLKLTWSALVDTYAGDTGFIGVVLSSTYLSGVHGFDSVSTIINAIDSGADYHYGWRFLVEPIAGAIPYTVWPDKPIPLNTAVNLLMMGAPLDYYDPSGSAGGVVGTVLGDLYWAGGTIGIIGGMLLIGLLYRFVDSLASSHRAFPVFIYSFYYPVFFMFISTIGSGLIRIVYFSIFLYFLYRVVRVSRPIQRRLSHVT